KRRITKTELPHIGVHRVRYTELDENRHLNNAVYSDILIDYLPETVPNSHIKRCQINFNSEATLGDLLDIYSKKENDGFVMITKNITAQKVCFEAELFFD
ncbi:MAG: thioesterase, partial [Clostridia bacterium]